MSKIMNSIQDIRSLDELALKGSFIHRLHPVVKLLTTIFYLVVVVSFDRFEIFGLLPLFFYPIIIFAFADISITPILKKLLYIEPFIIMVAVFNPIFDNQIISINGFYITSGWITFISILIKSLLTVTTAILLISTTGMDKIAEALRFLKVPRVFVLQLLLTYRYITVLLEEVNRILLAYSLRAPEQKGINPKAWGSLAGQLLLRTFDRAGRVYEAMCLRGFVGEYNSGQDKKIKARDIFYLIGWIVFFTIERFYNIPIIIGRLLTGVFK